MSNSELAASYAALILADEEIEVTALEGKNVKDMLTNVGSGGGAAAAPTGGAGGAAPDAPAEEAKKEEKEEGIDLFEAVTHCATLTQLFSSEKEESDEDMGFGLFD
ncbi:MAG: hypothetical protein Q9183_001083 [Haloplaca sp. 2 TL-2023]